MRLFLSARPIAAALCAGALFAGTQAAWAGAQKEEYLADAVRSALSAAVADSRPLRPVFASNDEQLGYLRWLAQHEQSGGLFQQAEVSTRQPLGALQLVGTIDRIDSVSTTGEPTPLVIDYKTESDAVTRKRIASGAEDTQLAFYAALLSHDTLRAAYVNVGERGETQMHEQDEVVQLRDLLVEGIQHDFARIAAGAPMPALGEGAVCDYCAARGLCRKDFW